MRASGPSRDPAAGEIPARGGGARRRRGSTHTRVLGVGAGGPGIGAITGDEGFGFKRADIAGCAFGAGVAAAVEVADKDD